MSAGKHTPGPWNNYQGDYIYCVYDASGKKICTIEPVDIVGWNAVHREEAEANETLIAAAPDLLEALIDCRRALEIANFTGELAVVNAAIAKATGAAE